MWKLRLVQCGKAENVLEEQLLTCDIGLEFLLLLEVVWTSGYGFVQRVLGL